MSGFRVSGIFPLNPDIFTDADYMPAYFTDRPAPVQAEVYRPITGQHEEADTQVLTQPNVGCPTPEEERNGVIEPCSDSKIENSYFMPHRPVVREDKVTSKVRMVFDASSKEKHLNSLNDCLFPGPNLNPNVLDIILSFRKHNVAFCADLEKAFLQIGIAEEDRNYLKFIWFSNERDDLISGAKSDKEVYYISSTASDIFKEAGMNLRKFNTNSVKLRKMWEEKGMCETAELRNDTLKILGLLWNTDSDSLHFDVPDFREDCKINPSKRVVLKSVLKIFDLLGILLPFTVRMKSLLQETWQRGIGWDENLPNDLKYEWESWCSEIDHLPKFEISRKYFPGGLENFDTIELHIFSDASPKAYGAVAYFRCAKIDNEIRTSLVWAKCRVSPIKRLTIPRLELMDAIIAARMCKYLKTVFSSHVLDVHIWSDSIVALHWIKGSPINWKPFVANRVEEIQSLTNPRIWNFTPGKANPGDLLTRGESLTSLVENTLWFEGPDWLSMPKERWPKHDILPSNNDYLIEKRSKLNSIQLSCNVKLLTEPLLDLGKFSKLNRVSPLGFSDSLITLIRKRLSCQVEDLKREEPINKNSPLYNLSPKLDEDGLLYLSGRLRLSGLPLREKNPWILPGGEQFTKLLILQAHEKVYHYGVATTLAHLRETYYIIKGRKYVKSVLKSCIICKRFKVRPGKEEIAPLPKDRIIESPPFETCAVDFAGPIFIKTKSGPEKLTLCSSPVELLELFIWKGLCKIVYSDNAKTFIKTDSLLKEVWSKISKAEVQQYFTKIRIVWKFIVPRASWWGGFWERMVRSVKTPLKKVLGRSCLSYEEIQTTLTEIEVVINGRPLTYVYDEINEPFPLTPSHFLIGKRPNFFPDIPSVAEPKSNKKTLTKLLRYRDQILNHFWKRWRTEYLLELRSANRIVPIDTPTKFKIGDVVIVHEDKVPKHMWKIGVVKDLFFGRDSKVRSCAVRTPSGVVRRPIQLLYNLELDIESVTQ
ncbi:uncharacterized protein LOC129218696 [Uloborus diversus]|uniref:uncharacterized protein LOC129218696 n=1 Tax=Uloborus diversus TaxID=327109 RepID=UPI0024095A89|nr:uncharacterized protein LOC129218696 [Uloborus diversus]